MKNVVRATLAVLLGISSMLSHAHAAQAADPLIARTHFIGSEQLFASADGKKLKELWTLPGSVAFRNEAVERFARLAPAYFGSQASAAQSDALLKPLFEDLLAYESYSDFRATPEMVLAIRLPAARAKYWDSALRQTAAALKLGIPVDVNADGFAGWELKRTTPALILRVGTVGDWTVVAAGPAKLSLSPALIANIKGQGRPGRQTGAWLEGELNIARLRGWLPLLNGFDNLPIARYSFSNRADFVRSVVTLDYAKPHGWKSEPWRVPTNSIFDPLASFVAVRGIAPILNSIPEVRQIGWSPTPNQVTGWGMRRVPFQFYYATPSQNITNQMKAIVPKVQQVTFNTHTNLAGGLTQNTNAWDLAWTGLPLAVPRLAALPRDPAFLVFEMFPLAATRNTAPKELFEQLSRTNLVMYDWEITEDRMPHWRQFYQLTEITTHRKLSPTNSPGAQFVLGLESKLGECVTEAVATSPTQITVVRKSPIGMNAFELVTLSRWIESTSFPAFGTFRPNQPRPALRTLPPPANRK